MRTWGACRVCASSSVLMSSPPMDPPHGFGLLGTVDQPLSRKRRKFTRLTLRTRHPNYTAIHGGTSAMSNADRPVQYMARTRYYYRALGYDRDYVWATHDDVPFTPLPKPLS